MIARRFLNRGVTDVLGQIARHQKHEPEAILISAAFELVQRETGCRNGLAEDRGEALRREHAVEVPVIREIPAVERVFIPGKFPDRGDARGINLVLGGPMRRLCRERTIQAITAIRREFPDARLIVLTTYDGDEDIYRSLQAGAKGYLLKDVFFEELETAIRTVHAGSRHIPAAIGERLAERMAGSDLTSREMEVLELIVRGQSNKEIGASLRISEATVKSHINNILSKLGVTDRTQAATTALQRGLVHLR